VTERIVEGAAKVDKAIPEEVLARVAKVEKFLSPEEMTSLVKNLDHMGINKTRFPGPVMGLSREEDIGVLFHHGVGVMSDQSKAVGELKKILVSPHESPADLRHALDAWSEANGVGYKFAFHDDILAKAEEYKRLGLISEKAPMGGYIAPNGYIDGALWSQLTKDGYFPIADPHDVLNHLPNLSESTFNTLFAKRTSMVADVNKELGFPDYNAEKALRESPDPRTKAYMAMSDHLGDHVRDSTHENWTYLVPDKDGAPTLFGGGNGGFNAIANGILPGEPARFTKTILNQAGKDATTKVQTMPFIDEFKKDPINKAVYDNYVNQLDKHAMSPESYKEASAKVEQFAKDHPIFGQPPKGTMVDDIGRPEPRYTAAETEVILKDFAKYASDDPQLSVILSQKGNQELYGSSVAFYQRYKTYIDGRFPPRPPKP